MDTLIELSDITGESFWMLACDLSKMYHDKPFYNLEIAVDMFGNACARFGRGQKKYLVNCSETDDLLEFVDKNGRGASWLSVDIQWKIFLKDKQQRIDRFCDFIAFDLRRFPFRDLEEVKSLRVVPFDKAKNFHHV